MFSRTTLLVTLSCFIGDTDDKNPLENLYVTSAAGSKPSAIRQTGYFVKIFICYAQRAKIHYWNCLSELPAGSSDALVDKEVEKEGSLILWMPGRMWHQYGIMPYYDSKDLMTLWLNKNDFFLVGVVEVNLTLVGECVLYYSIIIYGNCFDNQSLKFLNICGTYIVTPFIVGFSYCKASTIKKNICLT